ncbi:MAG: hypothetical protein AAGH60_01385 [Pseudomonadota bacterium]
MNKDRFFYASLPLAVLLVFPSAAEAAPIQLDWLVDTAMPFFETIVLAGGAAAVGWITARINRWFGINIDQKYAGTLHGAVERALRASVSHLRNELHDRAVVDVESELIANTAIYLEQLVPDALQHFGLTDENLDRLIRAHLSPELLHWSAQAPQMGPTPQLNDTGGAG